MQYVRIVNGIPENYDLRMLKRDNPSISFPSEIPDATLSNFNVFVLQETVIPSYDPRIEAVTAGTPVFQAGAWKQVWIVTPHDQATLDQIAQNDAESKSFQAIDIAQKMVFKEQMSTKLDVLTDEELEVVTYLYDEWSSAAEVLAVGDLRRYQGILYRTKLAHTSQVDWTPVLTLGNLWERVRESGDAIEWFVGEAVTVGTKRMYQGTLYNCILAHTTQADWTPPAVLGNLWEVAV